MKIVARLTKEKSNWYRYGMPITTDRYKLACDLFPGVQVKTTTHISAGDAAQDLRKILMERYKIADPQISYGQVES